MEIRIIGINVLIHQMDDADIKCLCDKHLRIDYQRLQKTIVDNTITLEYLSSVKPSIKSEPSVIIITSPVIETTDCNVTLNLYKPFFDAAIDVDKGFDLSKLLKFISRYKHTIKQLDLAFIDDDKSLSAREIEYWCRNSKNYCVGSLVKWNAPKFVQRNGLLRRIKLESASANKTNYGIINISPKSGRISMVLKIRKKQKIQYLLQDYGCLISQLQAFEIRSCELLVSCIDFVTVRSKKNRVKSRYERQASWQSFLGHKVEAINWSNVCHSRNVIA